LVDYEYGSLDADTQADVSGWEAAPEDDAGGVDTDLSADASSLQDDASGDDTSGDDLVQPDAAPPGPSCADVPCFPGVVCTDQPSTSAGDSFVCGNCPTGYTGDGVSCTDINGCASAPCYPGVVCSDVPANQEAAVGAAFTCGRCPTGYSGDGITCTVNPPSDCTTWDYSANAPCPSGILNCDCSGGCGSTSCSTVTPPPTGQYETVFHHTTTASRDGGKSLVLCPGQRIEFDSCSCNGVNIPRHGDDNNRETYWNMFQEPVGDIVCRKNGVEYRYRANGTVVYGHCS
jgi:hypothetical protein